MPLNSYYLLLYEKCSWQSAVCVCAELECWARPLHTWAEGLHCKPAFVPSTRPDTSTVHIVVSRDSCNLNINMNVVLTSRCEVVAVDVTVSCSNLLSIWINLHYILIGRQYCAYHYQMIYVFCPFPVHHAFGSVYLWSLFVGITFIL